MLVYLPGFEMAYVTLKGIYGVHTDLNLGFKNPKRSEVRNCGGMKNSLHRTILITNRGMRLLHIIYTPQEQKCVTASKDGVIA